MEHLDQGASGSWSCAHLPDDCPMPDLHILLLCICPIIPAATMYALIQYLMFHYSITMGISARTYTSCIYTVFLCCWTYQVPTQADSGTRASQQSSYIKIIPLHIV